MQGSIIIPAYNEEKRIVNTLRSVGAFLKTAEWSAEVIVVNDGSTDGTVKVVADLMSEIPNLRLISLLHNSGKGKAVKTGMLEAKGQWRLFMDADGSTSITELTSFLPLLSDYDIVIGSRRVAGAEIKIPQGFLRETLGSFFRVFVSSMLSLGISDSQNGFKLFSAAAAEKLFSEQVSSGWAFDVEILARARIHNFKIKEVPIHWNNMEESKMTLKGMFNMLYDVFHIRSLIKNAQN